MVDITWLIQHKLGPWVLLIFIWEIAWKGVALWKSAQKKDKAWFIAMLILNTFGILPIIYIYYFSRKNG